MQIFKQKLKKIQSDLVKLNKKYAGKTKKRHYKSKVLKGGVTSVSGVHGLLKQAFANVPPREMDEEARKLGHDVMSEFKETAKNAERNPKMLSGLLEALKRFFKAIFDFISSLGKGSKKSSTVQPDAEEEVAEAHLKLTTKESRIP